MPPANQPSNPNVGPASETEQLKAPSSIEALPQAPAAPEVAPQPNADAAPAAQQPVQIPNIPVTTPAAQGVGVSTSTAPVPGAVPTPSIAGDVDVIEKDWVDQAEKIIEQTKNDPYAEEEAIEALQIDYLKKRYGHDVKKPDQPGGA